MHYTTLQYTTLHCTALHYTNCITLHGTTPLYTTPQHTTLIYTTLHYPTPHYITLRYTRPITPPQMHLQLHYTNYTAPQLQFHHATTTTTAALHHTTSSSCGWGDDQVTTATIATSPKNTAHSSIHLLVHQCMDSLCHPWFTRTNLSYRFPIFETSATALCGTTGNQPAY